MSGADNNRREDYMARTIRVKLYKLNELSEEIKSKVIDKFRYSQVEYNEWYDSTYEDFKMICDTIGVDVDLKKTYFSGFSSQGDGASFTASVDVPKLIDGINRKKYLEHAPKIHEEVKSFTPSFCEIDKRVLDLIKREWIDISVSIHADNRPCTSRYKFEHSYTHGDKNNIEKQIEYLDTWIDGIVSELDNLLYRLLEIEHDFLTSDDSVKEHIIASEYEFTKDGKQY